MTRITIDVDLPWSIENFSSWLFHDWTLHEPINQAYYRTIYGIRLLGLSIEYTTKPKRGMVL